MRLLVDKAFVQEREAELADKPPLELRVGLGENPNEEQPYLVKFRGDSILNPDKVESWMLEATLVGLSTLENIKIVLEKYLLMKVIKEGRAKRAVQEDLTAEVDKAVTELQSLKDLKEKN